MLRHFIRLESEKFWQGEDNFCHCRRVSLRPEQQDFLTAVKENESRENI